MKHHSALTLFALLLLFAFPQTLRGQDSSPANRSEETDQKSDTSNDSEPPRAVKFEDPTTESIKSAQSDLETDTELSAEDKKALLAIYQRAADSLAAANKDKKAADAQRQLKEEAPDRIKALENQLEEISSTNAPSLKIPEGISKDSELKPLQDTLKATESRLTALKGDQSKINASITDLQSRPERNAKTKVETEQALATIEAALASETKESTSSDEGKARLASLLARRLAAQNQLDLIQLQTDSRENEVKINNIARELKIRQIAQSNKTVQQLKEWVDKKTADLAKEAELAAIQAEKEARLKHPIIQAIAATNTFYASQLKDVTSINSELSNALIDLKSQSETTKASFTNLWRQFDAAGLSETLAELLISEQRELPPRSDLEKRRKGYKDILSTNLLASIQVNTRLEKLALAEKEAEQVLADSEGLSDSEKAALLPDILSALAQQKATLEQLREGFDSMKIVLQNLDSTEGEFSSVTADFREFINQRLLWTPSSGPVHFEDIGYTRKAVRYLVNSDHWADLGLAIARIFREQAFLSWVVILLTIVIVLLHRKLTQFYVQIAGQTKRVRTDKFALTFRALIITVFELSPYYLVTRFFGEALQGLEDATPFVIAIGFALERAIYVVMPFVLIMGICRPRGLGEEHFKWSEQVVAILRKYSIRYLVIAWACWFIIGIFYSDTAAAPMGGLGRICYLVSTVVLAYYVWRLFHPNRGFFWGILKEPPHGLVHRSRVIWYPFALLTPLALAGIAIAGYMYTGVVLNVHLNRSLYLLVFVIIIYQLAKRWFLIRQRRAVVSQELERRRAAAVAAAEAEGETGNPATNRIDIDEPEIDYSEIKLQTLELMRMIAGLVLVVGLWITWADVVPMLGYLDNFVLWNSSRTIEGQVATVPITLAGVLSAIVVFVGTIIAYRNTPGLLDVGFLQNTKLRPGSRYAIKTLTQYSLFVIGASIVATKLGVNWSQLGWMAAALSVGLGFGLQEVVANFVCGILLFVERPVRVGDVVTVSDVTGTVVRIQIRATTIMDWDRREYVVPNKEFIAGRILNWTLSNSVNRLVIQTGVAYGTDTEKACRLMVEAAEEHPNILSDPKPFAIFEDFAESYLAINLRCYLPNVDNRLSTQHELRTAIDNKFKEAGIVIPFPQRDLHIRSIDDSVRFNHEQTDRQTK